MCTSRRALSDAGSLPVNWLPSRLMRCRNARSLSSTGIVPASRLLLKSLRGSSQQQAGISGSRAHCQRCG